MKSFIFYKESVRIFQYTYSTRGVITEKVFWRISEGIPEENVIPEGIVGAMPEEIQKKFLVTFLRKSLKQYLEELFGKSL